MLRSRAVWTPELSVQSLNAPGCHVTVMASSRRRCLRSGLVSLLIYCVYTDTRLGPPEEAERCDSLRLGQYLCKDPKIDEATQEPENCRDATAWVECLPAPNISCRLSNGTEFRFSGGEVGFNKTIPCRNVSGYSYKVAVALSLFLGWLGADRFYLGYPALGLLKFCTVGFCGIGTLIDFILIAMQIVGPADGSNYIVDYYGTRLTRLSITNQTYRKPHLSL
ncbi:TM2 domain-containing protein 1 [Larimichthys crocea]|uniref:TM2 domain-containing protein 1 n=1 Tax=Larimichthys crocea TaxID=215358 RepID=UPI000F5DCBC4|nr:TM2 domain-containing protein 1 [Larimichthys crocea]